MLPFLKLNTELGTRHLKNDLLWFHRLLNVLPGRCLLGGPTCIVCFTAWVDVIILYTEVADVDAETVFVASVLLKSFFINLAEWILSRPVASSTLME
jgi:hypothetical protein